MEINELLARCDHTLLDRCATWEDVKAVLDDAIEFGTASACIPPYYVKEAKAYVGSRLKICTVIGFPNGYSTAAAKLAECEEAIISGADEIDTVVNLCQLKSGRHDEILNELRALKSIVGTKILKVIIETCLLTDEEKITLSRLVTESGADYIKTSTGFSTGGATFSDVALLREHIGADVKVKAAGGISSIEDAEEFVRLGADRLGTSRLIKLAKGKRANEGY